jgi:hypothetical protein
MTVDNQTIRCDAYGCRNESRLDCASVFSPEYVRVRFAMHGWTPAGDDGEMDFCPDHT